MARQGAALSGEVELHHCTRRKASRPPVGQGGAQESRFVNSQAWSELQFAADVETSGYVVEGVRVHQPAEWHTVIVVASKVD